MTGLVLTSGARAGGTLERLLAKAFSQARVGEFLAGTEMAYITACASHRRTSSNGAVQSSPVTRLPA
jgi:hypothetical protein